MMTRLRGWRLVGALFSGLVLVAGPVAAEDDISASSGDPGGDELVFLPPPGWHAAHQKRDKSLYEITYVPDGQNATDWTEAARAQIFFGLADEIPALTPADFTENLLRYYKGVCRGAKASPPSSWNDHGYTATVRMISCARQLGDQLGSVSMVKVMRGRASIFVLDRSWRGSAFAVGTMPVGQDMRDDWAEFLAKSFLCNRQDSETPCPKSP